MTQPTDIESQLPLTEVTFYILLSLASGARHGYAIMKDVQSMSRERIHLSTGTLYGAIKRLLESGWITPASIPVAQVDGRVRKAYQLSELGRQILLAEATRLNHLASAAQQRILGNQSAS